MTHPPTAPTLDAVDLFAGPGGWDLAARALGLAVLGIEWDADAVATRAAAFGDEGDHAHTVHGDVRDFGPAVFPSRGLIASPPCQTFSLAGKGAGRAALDVVLALVARMARREPLDLSGLSDERTALVLEPLRWALEALDGGTPYEWLAFEQVPTVLPVWEAVADVLRAEGYSVATGFVHAEQYGTPQTRKRAVLVARRSGEARLPKPTHSRYHSRSPERLDEGVLPWVSMAEALGWGLGALVGFPRRDDGRPGGAVVIGDAAYRARDLRAAADPAQTVTEKARSWVRFEVDRAALVAEVEPRVNNQSGTAFDLTWPADRPAPTIAGREIVTMPGANANRFNGSTKSRNDGIRVTADEAAILQSFPSGYPWQGSKSSAFQQIGNAVPPLLAAAVLAEVTGR